MKHLAAIFILVLGMTIKLQAQNDPSYSVHNYKHPNKAAYAKKHNLDKLNYFEYKNESKLDNSKRNYKDQRNVGNESTSGAVITTAPVEKNPNGFFSKRNYKHQF
jgi:hypothetical protein